MARQAPRRLLKSLGFASGITFTGAAAVFLTSKPLEQATSPPDNRIQRTSNNKIIPPRFPKIKSRTEQLADLRRACSTSSRHEEYDLLIIGGGATGSGIALDAATRGLKVALVERDDFASGTSSKSTKLVHGGVRYLEKAVWNLDYDPVQLGERSTSRTEELPQRCASSDFLPTNSTTTPEVLASALFLGWYQMLRPTGGIPRLGEFVFSHQEESLGGLPNAEEGYCRSTSLL